MRYLTVSEYGSFLGLNSNCLVVKHNGEIVKEIALSHLRVIAILKSGVSLSSDLIQACAERSIKIFFLDWRQRIYSAVIGQNHHATVALRKAQ
ncbi:MAG: CRISPR-associated endonuclease Cas1 [Succinivibrio sp.]